MNGWAKIKAASKYAGISERTMRDWLKAGLRHSRLPSGTILVQYVWVDEFLNRFETKNETVEEITDQIVEDVCNNFNNPRPHDES